MQKIGVSVLENMAKKNITNRELDFILYIARYQNEYGIATGIYYKDVCEAIHLSYQGFYDCKKSLEDKEIISCQKNSYYDWDITIIDNSFKGKENYGRGYISIYCDMVRDPEFHECRAGAKILGLLLMREWKINLKKSGSYAYQLLKTNFIKKYTALLGVSVRILRSYLGELKPFLNVYLEKGRKYYFTFKDNAIKMKSKVKSENEELRTHDIFVACRRNRIKEVSNKNINDICGVLRQHHKKIEKLFEYDLSNVVGESLKRINQLVKNKQKWKRTLNIPLIHKVLLEQF